MARYPAWFLRCFWHQPYRQAGISGRARRRLRMDRRWDGNVGGDRGGQSQRHISKQKIFFDMLRFPRGFELIFRNSGIRGRIKR